MLEPPRPIIKVAPQYQPILRELGIDAETIFTHPLVKPWRRLDDRDNSILETTLQNGRKIRWHVKRYEPARGFTLPADDEIKGHNALAIERIPTATLVAWGKLNDRRSFIIFDDLAGYSAADKLIESGVPFERILIPTADLAALLHTAGLHHRDLYLCHFFVKLNDDAIDVRLIDSARVRRLPGVFTRMRWIVKDLAQFWYSTTKLPINDGQRIAWLSRYIEQSGGKLRLEALRAKIERKVRSIAAHDARLRQQQPTRNISIPIDPPQNP